MGLYNESLNQNIDNLQVNGRLGNGSGGNGSGGTSFKSEILYTNSGTNRDNIELSKPYTEFDYLDVTVVKYDDISHYDFFHMLYDVSQQNDITSNSLLAGRTNNNFVSVWSNTAYIRFRMTDDTHIEYPNSEGRCAIYQIKGIKF